MRVIGTAGHVDHGKSTLVRALSGIDPDRLKEEKARGMTIDLGFAWITLPDAGGALESVGIVDVPGHIDFIKNMLAGVGGIDAVLLVVAADEGVMPQTREHLAIVDLLAVPAGIVVLTKVDAVDDPEWLDLVELDIAGLVEATRLAHAPVVRVSAQTGAGLETLRVQLGELLSGLPARRDRARPRLPVDRVFTLSGFGTVVTGTLLDGTIAAGENLELLPSGLAARVRGLQTHKQQVEFGEPGSRLAINLSGIETSQIRRGDVVARPGTLHPTVLFDARVRVLPGAHAPLKHNARVDFFTGASEVATRVRVLGGEQIEPGDEGWVQLHMEQRVVVVEGDHFILRVPSPSATVGGGVVIDAHPGRRWRRFDQTILLRLQTRERASPEDVMIDLVVRSPFLSRSQALARSELNSAESTVALDLLIGEGRIRSMANSADPLLIEAPKWDRLVRLLQDALHEFHRQFPLRKGMTRSELRSRLQPAFRGEALTPRLFGVIVDRCLADELVAVDDERVWLLSFTPTPTAGQSAAVDRMLAAYAESPNAPPNWSETLVLLGGDIELLDMLVAQGVFVRLAGDVIFRREDFERMVEAVRERLREQGSITMAEARDLLGSSRKYVQALLEEMDTRRITRRDGDLRVLR